MVLACGLAGNGASFNTDGFRRREGWSGGSVEPQPGRLGQTEALVYELHYVLGQTAKGPVAGGAEVSGPAIGSAVAWGTRHAFRPETFRRWASAEGR